MIVTVIEAAADPVVDLDTAKAHLNVDTQEFDELIEAYVAAATGTIDGPDGWLGRALGVQTLEARLDAFPSCPSAYDDPLLLPCPPLIEIVSIKYLDDAGELQTLDADRYALDAALGGVQIADGDVFPATRLRRGAVRIRYQAGYAAGAIPKPIVAAILLMTGDLFANRETVAAGQVGRVPMSTTVENLLAPFRKWSV